MPFMNATLKAGTIYTIFLQDETESSPMVLSEDIQVKIILMDEHVSVYEDLNDGDVLYVRPEGDVKS